MGEVPGADGCPWAAADEGLVATLAPSWLHTQQGGSEELTQPHHDPYANPYAVASLAAGAHPAFPEAGRGGRRRVMKRKVLRHRPDGGVEVSDESVSSEPESEAELRSRSAPPPLIPRDDSISEGEMETSSSSLEESPSHRASPPFLRDHRSSASSHHAPGHPKSYIPPRLELPGRGRTDPVAKYYEYKREWERFHVPGQEQWLELRWGVREQLRQGPPAPRRPQHQLLPNSYPVPTEKRRASLRWEVRWDLAHGLLPRCSSS